MALIVFKVLMIIEKEFKNGVVEWEREVVLL